MTSGWEAASEPIALDPPWEAFWIRVYLDPVLGDYLDMQAAAAEAEARPSEASIDALIATIPPLIASHNITGRDGAPIEWRTRAMGTRLIGSIAAAIKRSQDGGGSADPLPLKPSSARRATSRPRG